MVFCEIHIWLTAWLPDRTGRGCGGFRTSSALAMHTLRHLFREGQLPGLQKNTALQVHTLSIPYIRSTRRPLLTMPGPNQCSCVFLYMHSLDGDPDAVSLFASWASYSAKGRKVRRYLLNKCINIQMNSTKALRKLCSTVSSLYHSFV